MISVLSNQNLKNLTVVINIKKVAQGLTVLRTDDFSTIYDLTERFE